MICFWSLLSSGIERACSHADAARSVLSTKMETRFWALLAGPIRCMPTRWLFPELRNSKIPQALDVLILWHKKGNLHCPGSSWLNSQVKTPKNYTKVLSEKSCSASRLLRA